MRSASPGHPAAGAVLVSTGSWWTWVMPTSSLPLAPSPLPFASQPFLCTSRVPCLSPAPLAREVQEVISATRGSGVITQARAMTKTPVHH